MGLYADGFLSAERVFRLCLIDAAPGLNCFTTGQ